MLIIVRYFVVLGWYKRVAVLELIRKVIKEYY
jgi:hypothetical protein